MARCVFLVATTRENCLQLTRKTFFVRLPLKCTGRTGKNGSFFSNGRSGIIGHVDLATVLVYSWRLESSVWWYCAWLWLWNLIDSCMSYKSHVHKPLCEYASSLIAVYMTHWTLIAVSWVYPCLLELSLMNACRPWYLIAVYDCSHVYRPLCVYMFSLMSH